MRLSRGMLLLLIILIIEARTFAGFVPPYGPVVLVAPNASTIETKITGARSGFDTPASTPAFTLQDLTLTNSLTVLGSTLFGKTSVAGGLTIDGTISLGVQGIQSLGNTLYVEQNKLAAIDLMSGALRVNTDGSVIIADNLDVLGALKAETIAPIRQDLTIDLSQVASSTAGFGSLLIQGTGGSFSRITSSGSALFTGNIEASGSGTFARILSPLVETAKLFFTSSDNSNSVGLGTLPMGFKTMSISTNAITASSRVFLTPISVSTQPISVTHITPASTSQQGSFTVETALPALQNLDFSWFIIN